VTLYPTLAAVGTPRRIQIVQIRVAGKMVAQDCDPIIYCRYLSDGLSLDFVLTGLAGLNGIDLIDAMLKKKPDQRLGFSTAYPVRSDPLRLLNCGFCSAKISAI
jgi:hypothetical protein